MNHVVCAIFCLTYLALHAFEIHPSYSNVSVLHLFLWINYTHGMDILQFLKFIHAIFLAVVNIAAVSFINNCLLEYLFSVLLGHHSGKSWLLIQFT